MNASGYERYQDWKAWSTRPFGAGSPRHAAYFAEELRLSGVESVKGKTLLEIGFGNGEFAAWARDAGADYLGTELLDGLVATGAAAGLETHDGQLPLEQLRGEQSIDLIVAFDVFEHLDIDALRAMLRSARRALRVSGRLIVRVPSGDSPFSGAIQHGDCTHRITIGSSMIGQLACEAGFQVHAARPPAFPLWGLGFRTFVRRAIVAGVQAMAFAIIRRAFMGGGRPVLTPDMVCVLVKP